MAYERKTWVSKNPDGSIPSNAIPINADNLNNIEDGIEEALTKVNSLEISSKEYADTNILYFYGNGTSSPSAWVNLFQLPEDIEFSKYIPLIQFNLLTNYSHLAVAPYDSTITLYYESFKYVQFKISSEGLVSFYDDATSSRSFSVKIILIPVQKTELTPIS